MSSFKGHFCDKYNRRTSANHGWCSEIELKKEFAELQRQEDLKKQYLRGKAFLEQYGIHSKVSFEKWERNKKKFTCGKTD